MEQQCYIVTGEVGLSRVPLPVVPLYDLKLAAGFIPISYNGLKGVLAKHKDKFLPRYRRRASGGKVRLLSATEISELREMILKGPGVANVLEVCPELDRRPSVPSV